MADEPIELSWKDLFKPIKLEAGKPASFVIRKEAIPIIFVPGIMGSRLKRTSDGEKVWDPDAKGFMLWNYGMAWVDAADKKAALIGPTFNKDFLTPLLDDQEHNREYFGPERDALGWGGVAWSSYGEVLTALVSHAWPTAVQACFDLPVYAFGYNWSASNVDSGRALKEYIDTVVKENNVPEKKVTCEHVVLVTHSMGGLVARQALKAGAAANVLGVVHGVQPVTGSGAAYWRMKAGFERKYELPNPAAWVLGTNGAEVTALLGHMPGGLQLLPSPRYKDNSGSPHWLRLEGPQGLIAQLPERDAYEEIYKNADHDAYYRLINQEYLLPEKKPKITLQDAWETCTTLLDEAKAFHEDLGDTHHDETQAFYGSGLDTPDRVVFKLAPHGWKETAAGLVKVALKARWAAGAFGVWGVAAYLGYEALTHTEYWQSRGGFKTRIPTAEGVTFDVELIQPAGNGDGTVPASSGKALDQTGQAPEKAGPAQEFVGVEHEPAFKDQDGLLSKLRQMVGGAPSPDTLKFTLDAVTRLFQLKITRATG